jgi:hypothetical protein
MPGDKNGFDLGDYVEVKDRIRILYELYPQARLVTRRVAIEQLSDGEYVVVHALAYRTPDDPYPGTGTSWMKVPGTTNYTRGSEVENAETSAWGRAIGSLGILIDHSIASRQEVENKQDDGKPSKRGSGLVYAEVLPPSHDAGGLVGVAEVGTARDSDFNLREAPDGWTLGFRLKSNGKGGIKVLARDALALALSASKDTIVGQRVTCWGHISDETFTPKGSTRKVTYQVLQLERIQAPDFVMPGQTDANPDAVSPTRQDYRLGPKEPLDPRTAEDDEAERVIVAEGQVAFELTDDEKAAIAGGLPG